MAPKKQEDMAALLAKLYSRLHHRDYLKSDPLEFVHAYSDPWDQEAVALLSALFAYGSVAQIKRSVRSLLGRMAEVSDSPAAFVRALPSWSEKKREQVLGSFIHRFNTGRDVEVLLSLLSKSWRNYGSLGSHFVRGLSAQDPTIESALETLTQQWKEWARPQALKSFSFLVSSPSDQSCCKRWCMFLRWMVRKDELDVGLWSRRGPIAQEFPQGKKVYARQLVIPLDTHTGRISQALGLTQRRSLNWKAALEVTRNLSVYDPQDPVKYDFALCRIGMLELHREFGMSQ